MTFIKEKSASLILIIRKVLLYPPKPRTGIQTEPTEPVGDPPAANFSVDPLAEFSSWYPPVWSPLSEQDYSLVDVPAGTQAYRSVRDLFYDSLPETMVDLVSIQQVQNLLHWDKYQRYSCCLCLLSETLMS